MTTVQKLDELVHFRVPSDMADRLRALQREYEMLHGPTSQSMMMRVILSAALERGVEALPDRRRAA